MAPTTARHLQDRRELVACNRLIGTISPLGSAAAPAWRGTDSLLVEDCGESDASDRLWCLPVTRPALQTLPVWSDAALSARANPRSTSSFRMIFPVGLRGISSMAWNRFGTL